MLVINLLLFSVKTQDIKRGKINQNTKNMYNFLFSFPIEACFADGLKLDEILRNICPGKLGFQLEFDKNSAFAGICKVQNMTNNTIKLRVENNLSFIMGFATLQDIKLKSNPRSNFNIFSIPPSEHVDTRFDLACTIREFSVYSENMFNFRSEICFKVLTERELNQMFTKRQSNSLACININSQKMKITKFPIEETFFFIRNCLSEKVVFEFCELISFIENM